MASLNHASGSKLRADVSQATMDPLLTRNRQSFSPLYFSATSKNSLRESPDKLPLELTQTLNLKFDDNENFSKESKDDTIERAEKD